MRAEVLGRRMIREGAVIKEGTISILHLFCQFLDLPCLIFLDRFFFFFSQMFVKVLHMP